MKYKVQYLDEFVEGCGLEPIVTYSVEARDIHQAFKLAKDGLPPSGMFAQCNVLGISVTKKEVE